MAVRAEIAKDRGFITDDLLTGEGLFYHYVPNATLPGLPWVKIDSFGYRNREGLEGKVDVVFLGDSITIAQNAQKDFADYFRSRGLSARNLGNPGYSAYHYRDAYKRLIVDPKVQHEYLVIILCGDNDFPDSLRYARVAKRNESYREYLGRPLKTEFWKSNHPYFPWLISIALNSSPLIKSMVLGQGGSTRGVVRLPFGEYETDPEFLRIVTVDERYLSWQHLTKAIDEILEMAGRQGVKTLIAYYPSSRLIYGPYLVGHPDFKEQTKRNHERLMALMEPYFDRPGVRFADLTAFMQAAAAREPLGGSGPLDYHPNTRGAELVGEWLYNELKKMN